MCYGPRMDIPPNVSEFRLVKATDPQPLNEVVCRLLSEGWTLLAADTSITQTPVPEGAWGNSIAVAYHATLVRFKK